MAPVPSFFFSHARQDREVAPGNYLRRFFDDLESKLAQWTGVDLKVRRLGTIDARVRHGADWDTDLSRGLRSDNTFVAILTPLYFNRPNCGKELSVFLLRSPELGVDQGGALTGARNVMLVRWLPESAYTTNTSKNSLIPLILRRIEDTPPDEGGDQERTQAIERYCKKGMEKCVAVQPYYGELLDLFVASIRDMPDLPPLGSAVSFATANDAFKFDWAGYLGSVSLPAAPPSTPAVAPRALGSIVAFYVTHRSFTRDPNTVDFADSLIAETLSSEAPSADPAFGALLADVRAAGVAEGFSVFHAVDNPIVPTSPERLLGRLASLSKSRVLTALVVEPTVWPGAAADGEATSVEQIIRSSDWTGPVLLPILDAPTLDVDKLVAERGLPSRLIALPQASEARVAALRRAFVDARGRVLRTSTELSPEAEHVPALKGVGAERT
jgi:hypothetical protein